MTKLEFKEGEQVRFRVRADGADEIHVHGYDIEKDVGRARPSRLVPGRPSPASSRSSCTDAGEQIAQLRVDPE